MSTLEPLNIKQLDLNSALFIPINQFLKLGDLTYDITYKPMVMGVLNRTTDSFFDEGSYYGFDDFLQKAEMLVKDGADILDVGGVKAGSGDPVSLSEELERVVPAVLALKERFDIPLSVDTWNSTVLEESAKAGAIIGNDISGFSDENYLKIAADYDLAVVATHIRVKPRIVDPNPVYNDLIGDVFQFLKERVDSAIMAGVNRNSIMADIGPDLGKTTSQSLKLFAYSKYFRQNLDIPMFLSASNKGFLGDILNLEVKKRKDITNAAIALGYFFGNRIFRVHDVASAAHMLKGLSFILQSKIDANRSDNE
jgi:dihydropteroate synthase